MTMERTDEARARPTAAGAPVRRTLPTRYTLEEFLDDHRGVVEVLGCADEACWERAIDGGRLLPLALHVVHWHDDEAQDAIARVFARKYGHALGAEIQDRFFRVMRFLEANGTTIERDGFARLEHTPEVHEELLGYLLDEAAANPMRPISPSSLRRFYDGWGERWF